jgi:hypothetical protein
MIGEGGQNLIPRLRRGLICIFTFCIFNFAFKCFALEITILYTGSTHAMLYPCSCPRRPEGGVARRATLIEEVKKKNPAVLILDAGGFFAGGLLDEYTQNTQLDTQRTLVNLKAMELMQYDAVLISDDEFNFGREFLQENIAKTKIAFLSSNLKFNSSIQSGNPLPYLLKEINGIKIGIIGVSNPAVKQKASDIEFIEPRLALKQAIEECKQKGSKIIVLLSHLSEKENFKLINELDGINVLITGYNLEKETKEISSNKIKDTFVLYASWQGRQIGRLSLVVNKDGKIKDYRMESVPLSEKIKDSPKILSILPRCFRDTDCKDKELTGICLKPGSLSAHCQFSRVAKVNLTVVTAKDCSVCFTEEKIKQLKGVLPGLVTTYFYYPDRKSNRLIKNLGINALPVYLLGKEVEKEKVFENLKEKLERRLDYYLLKPQFSGLAYFIERKKIEGSLDLFISLFDKYTVELLEAIKDFHPNLHFLANEKNNTFEAAGGNLEVEEYLRSVCVQKYNPEIFWDYLNCRAKNINSSWWDDCLGTPSETYKIKTCAKGEEGANLLRENIKLNKELQVMFGPTYLWNNQEIFSTEGVPTKESLRRIFKK